MTPKEANAAARAWGDADPEAVVDLAIEFPPSVLTALKAWLRGDDGIHFWETEAELNLGVAAQELRSTLLFRRAHALYRRVECEPGETARRVVDILANLPPEPGSDSGLSVLALLYAEQPTPVERNTRPDRIIPARLAMASEKDKRVRTLFSPAMHLQQRDDGGQDVLPGFSAYINDLPTPALPLALYDLGVGKEGNRGGYAAPLALRLWIEGVLGVHLDDRIAIDKPMVLNVPLSALWPDDLPKRKIYMPQLCTAMEVLDSFEARIPWEDPETGQQGIRRVVSVTDIISPSKKRGRPTRDEEEPYVRLVIDLPPRTNVGPVVSPRLPWWGMVGASYYRALIGLAYRWYGPGVTRVPIGKKGHYAQVNDPSRYNKLTDAEMIALCFPTSTRGERRKLAFEAVHVLDNLVRAGEARDVGGKLLPPVGRPGRQLRFGARGRRRVIRRKR